MAASNEDFASKHLDEAYKAYNNYLEYCSKLNIGQVPNAVQVFLRELDEICRRIGKHRCQVAGIDK